MILRMTLRPTVKAGEGWEEYRTWREMRVKRRKMKLQRMAENAEKVWKTIAWVTYDGDV